MDNKPEKITLVPNTYAFCTCKLSNNFPYCDGSHKGTSFIPKIEIIESPKDIYVCRCGKTANSPLCDGSHISLEANNTGH